MFHKISIIYTTINDKSKAAELAKKSIELNLSACVNLFPSGYSFYEWNSEIVTEEEFFMIFKTTKCKVEKLVDFIKNNHTYEQPAIIKIDCESEDNFYKFISDKIVKK